MFILKGREEYEKEDNRETHTHSERERKKSSIHCLKPRGQNLILVACVGSKNNLMT